MDQNIRRSIEPADVKKDEVRVFDLDDHYRDLVDKAKDIIHPDSMDQCMEAYNPTFTVSLVI
jgi:hypothetical protein